MKKFLDQYLELSLQEQEGLVDCIADEQFIPLLHSVMDGEANPWQRNKLERILKSSPRCLAYFKQEVTLRNAVRDSVPRLEAPESFKKELEMKLLSA